MNSDILFFFGEHMDALPLYERLEDQILTQIPEVKIKVAKTQITFANKRGFAFVSFNPCRKAKNRPEIWMTITFGLGYRIDSPRIDVATEPYPNRWTHHVMVGNVDEIDVELMRWIAEAAEAVLMTARLSYLPSLGLTAEGNANKHDGATAKTYNVGASASWELDIFGKLTAAKRGAAAALQGSRAYRQAVQTQLVATIADSYYTLAMLDAQMTISNRTLENWRTTVRTLEALKKVGKSNEAGVLQAKANVMRLEASLLSIRKSISETENALSAILAMPSHSIGRSDLAEAAFPDTVSIGVPLQLLSNRPDVRQAEMELAQAFYATNAARAAFYPNITLSGILGWTNNGGGVIVNPGQWLLNAIGSLTQPLFNRGVNIANLKIAKSRQEEAKLLFRQSLLNAGKEVNDALTAWQTAKSQIEINARQVETLCDAVRKTESLMRHSNTTYLEVLTAKQSLLEAEVQQLQTRFERIQSIIKLYHALGGGM